MAAVGAWAIWQRASPPATGSSPTRDELGLAYPEAGYVLCPQGLGLKPTDKSISVGDYVVVWLASISGAFVEATWAKVARVDPVDPNRLLVVLGSQYHPALAALRTGDHGFVIGSALWVTADCVSDVLRAFPGRKVSVLCGAALASLVPGARQRATALPSTVHDMVGREVDLVLRSAYASRVPARGHIVSVSPTGQIATVALTSVTIPGALAYGPTVADLRPGTTFDITWDCVLSFGAQVVV